ncbi:MAG: hypothetical protein WAW39_23415 [Prosthecobacter sp.]|uniref:hypothetical protein n=1 Tax=Prosthecobacter sp. TaxID=1965333 RepID=UPI003BAE9207
MTPHALLLIFVAAWLASCAADPTLAVSNTLGRHDLRGKTLAVGGLTAQEVMVYPGRTEEGAILQEAGKALDHRLRHSRVLTMEAARDVVGFPPSKFSAGVPIVLGSKLSPGFIRKAHAEGLHYLLWIDLRDNSVDHSSRQRQNTRTVYSSCSCGKIGDKTCRTGSCCSGCSSSCRSSTTVTVYSASEFAIRRVAASYTLLDTASGKTVWQAESLRSDSNVNTATSESGLPMPPSVPLPPTESQIMKRMTTCAIARLPK